MNITIIQKIKTTKAYRNLKNIYSKIKKNRIYIAIIISILFQNYF